MTLSSISVAGLRAAGFRGEADDLEREVKRARLWAMRDVSENALALSLFGSIRHDYLAAEIARKEVA